MGFEKSLMVASEDFVFDTSAADAAEKELMSVLGTLPAANSATQRVKFLAMLDEKPGALLFTKLELAGTGPAYNIATACLYPTQRYWDIIAAIRAGNLDWDIERTCL
jgi:hypothetical protein